MKAGVLIVTIIGGIVLRIAYTINLVWGVLTIFNFMGFSIDYDWMSIIGKYVRFYPLLYAVALLFIFSVFIIGKQEEKRM
ncbi:MAG: hypothetical protein J6P45_04990 [Lachnospiraceae bacterium]|nr:hypothetical protein [Lachnospiraceae bacterium]